MNKCDLCMNKALCHDVGGETLCGFMYRPYLFVKTKFGDKEYLTMALSYYETSNNLIICSYKVLIVERENNYEILLNNTYICEQIIKASGEEIKFIIDFLKKNKISLYSTNAEIIYVNKNEKIQSSIL